MNLSVKEFRDIADKIKNCNSRQYIRTQRELSADGNSIIEAIVVVDTVTNKTVTLFSKQVRNQDVSFDI